MRGLEDLRGYQQRLVTRLYEHDITAAVVPMGGGKTVVALSAIKELIDDGHIRSAIVLAPKRVALLVWPKEVQGWGHLKDLRVRLVAGPAEQREFALGLPADVYVVGIDNTQWLVDWLAKHPDHPGMDMLVIDELSRFKNPRGKRGKALMKLSRRFKARVGLTGTPRPNGYEDLFRPMQLLTAGGLWGASFDKWREERFMPLDFHRRKWAIRPGEPERLMREIAPYWVTIGPEDMPELPELTTIRHNVTLPVAATQQYRTMEKTLLSKFPDRTVLAANAAVATGKLAQLAQGFMYDETGAVQRAHIEKADELVELIENLDGDPVLVCYEFNEDLAVLRALYPDAPWLGDGVSDKKAEQIEADWNAGKLPILFLHPASAGHGLNLQHGGAQMIWYALTWSPELYDQTRKRFHRPGQTRKCFEHIIVAEGTVDEAKYARAVEKLSMQDAFARWLPTV